MPKAQLRQLLHAAGVTAIEIRPQGGAVLGGTDALPQASGLRILYTVVGEVADKTHSGQIVILAARSHSAAEQLRRAWHVHATYAGQSAMLNRIIAVGPLVVNAVAYDEPAVRILNRLIETLRRSLPDKAGV